MGREGRDTEKKWWAPHFGGAPKERAYRLKVAHCRGSEDKSVLWSQAGRKWETPRHQETILIIRHTVSGHRHDLITERHWLQLPQLRAHCPFTGPYCCPSSGRSKTAGSAGRQQEHLLWMMPLCPSSLERRGCVKMLLCVRVEFCHKSLPCDFLESVASRTGEDFLHQDWLCVAHHLYSGHTDSSTGFLVCSFWLKS